MASSMMIQDFARTQVRMMMARTSRLSQKRALDVMVAKAHSSEHAQALEAAFAELVGTPPSAPDHPDNHAAHAPANPASGGLPTAAWLGGLIAIVLALVAFSLSH